MYKPDVVARYLDLFLKVRRRFALYCVLECYIPLTRVQHVHPFFPSVYPPACSLANVMAWLSMDEEKKKQQKTVYLQIHTVLAHGTRAYKHT